MLKQGHVEKFRVYRRRGGGGWAAWKYYYRVLVDGQRILNGFDDFSELKFRALERNINLDAKHAIDVPEVPA